MGAYDVLVENGRTVQVKCWTSDMRTFYIGDLVPDLRSDDGQRQDDYLLALAEGGFALILKNRFYGILDHLPIGEIPIYDKWGNTYTGPNHYSDIKKDFIAWINKRNDCIRDADEDTLTITGDEWSY